LGIREAHTIATTTKRQNVLQRDTSIRDQSLEVLLRRWRPSIGELGTLGRRAEIIANDKLAADLALG